MQISTFSHFRMAHTRHACMHAMHQPAHTMPLPPLPSSSSRSGGDGGSSAASTQARPAGVCVSARCTRVLSLLARAHSDHVTRSHAHAHGACLGRLLYADDVLCARALARCITTPSLCARQRCARHSARDSAPTCAGPLVFVYSRLRRTPVKTHSGEYYDHAKWRSATQRCCGGRGRRRPSCQVPTSQRDLYACVYARRSTRARVQIEVQLKCFFQWVIKAPERCKLLPKVVVVALRDARRCSRRRRKTECTLPLLRCARVSSSTPSPSLRRSASA